MNNKSQVSSSYQELFEWWKYNPVPSLHLGWVGIGTMGNGKAPASPLLDLAETRRGGKLIWDVHRAGLFKIY